MKEPMNLANALLVIACIYFLTVTDLGIWGKIGIIVILLFALGSWGWWQVTDDHKKMLSRQVDEIEARIRNINAHTTFMTTQSALTLRGIKQQR